MVGITRTGTYFPRRRLDRALIAKAWGGRVPAGARTVAGLDEDALTMATDAVLACLGDVDAATFDALYFASTSSPYLEKQVASVIATAAELEPLLGDGAAAVAVGGEGVVAELVSAASVAEEFTYLWRTDEQRTLRLSETRFGTAYGYVRDVAEAL